MILEEAGKARRDMIVIQNVPSDGIKIGRGHQCDIRVTDISVSRVHAFIKLVNGKFVLFDNESKFGTLVKLQRDIQINFEKKAFQIGRTVLTFKMKKPKLQREQSNEPMDIELENILKHI
jgi:pSer/pThr/pTyr-binding forkhead associated (FHA) protein